jgi:hypothetical protein
VNRANRTLEENSDMNVDVHVPQVFRARQVASTRQTPSEQAKEYKSILHLVLLLLVAAGILWSSVLVFRFLDFPVTVTILFTVSLYILGIGNWMRGRRVPNELLFPAAILILYELVVHGLCGGAISDPQWPRSFALLMMCAGLLIVSSKFRIHVGQLQRFSMAVSWVAYLMGGLGITQFVLANGLGYVWYPLPDALSLRAADINIDALRFSGLLRSMGISSEPSYYGLGMVVLFTLELTLIRLAPPDSRSRSFRGGALLMALGGVAVSASFAAWGALALVLLGWLVSRRKSLHERTALLWIVIGIVCTIAVTWPFLQPRIESVLTNPDDASMNYRLRTSVELIVAPTNDLVSSLLGTGVGIDHGNSRVLEIYMQYFGAATVSYWTDMSRSGSIVLVAGWAYVAVTLGWIGLALNGWILAVVFRGKGCQLVASLPLVMLLVAYFLAVGRYLSPEWWALLVLINALRRI